MRSRIGCGVPTGPRAVILVQVHRADGSIDAFNATDDIQTQLEVHLLRQGGVIPTILKRYVGQN